jgi:hypothetical protein
MLSHGAARARTLLDDLIVRLSNDCPWRDDPRGTDCGAPFADLAAAPASGHARSKLASSDRRREGIGRDVRQMRDYAVPEAIRRLGELTTEISSTIR